MSGRPSLIRKLAGCFLLGLGVLDLLLPILKGVLLIALGLFILRDQFDGAREGMANLRARWPRQVAGVERLEAQLVGWGERQVERVRRLLS